MVVELSWFQVEYVENTHYGPTTASTTNSTFNYVRDTALKRHEDGHIQHGRELALLVKERLMGLGVVPCDQMQALAEGEFQRLYGNLKARDQEYDARTNHGATQGTVF
ncbi:MAG: DUF922 domain-containing protein [Betaproteobacteria bacterium]|nr:DUF922 domain-containing protein [Betaproteobacteria bacterium]